MTSFTPRWSPRPGWAQAPPAVRNWAESLLGAPVASARDVSGGFSAGIASRLTGANDARLFVKAVTADLNPFSPRMVRRELRIGPALAATAAAAPTLRGGLDTGDWVAAAFDDIDGATPDWPWTEADAARTLDALGGLHRALTPAPDIPVPPAEHSLRGEIGAWTRLGAVGDADVARAVGPDPVAADPASADPEPNTAAPADPVPLASWLVAHRAELVARSAGIDVRGDTVLNLDVRADNVLLDRAGAVWFVDWPWACRGSATLDVVVLLVNFAVAGLDPEPWLARSHTTDSPELVTDMLCVLTGMWIEGSRHPEPPGTSGLGAFQRAHLLAALAWLRRRISAGW